MLELRSQLEGVRDCVRDPREHHAVSPTCGSGHRRLLDVQDNAPLYAAILPPLQDDEAREDWLRSQVLLDRRVRVELEKKRRVSPRMSQDLFDGVVVSLETWVIREVFHGDDQVAQVTFILSSTRIRREQTIKDRILHGASRGSVPAPLCDLDARVVGSTRPRKQEPPA